MPIDEWRHRGKRLLRMPPDELLDRTRRAMGRRFDAALGRIGFSFAGTAGTHSPETPGVFFFAPDSVGSILQLIRRRLPGRTDQIIREADAILQHKFDLLGYESVDYSSPRGTRDWQTIDWHWDAVHKTKAPKKASHKIHYLDFAECGDSKVIWELNRHQHLVTLAKAYRLTGDRRYLDEILQQTRHWRIENPYPFGINWTSSLEVAFRSLSWLWTYHLLLGSPQLPGIREEWLTPLALHGRHIEKYLSTYFSPNTHLLGEGVGLFFLGVLCPELKSAGRWKSLGWKIILQEAGRQVLGDGFHFEQSTHYHVYALDFFLHSALLAAANNIPAPSNFSSTIDKMLNALYLMGRSGPPPQLSDDDGGRVFDPRRNRAEHFLDPLATGAILFHRGDFKSVAANLTEESLWLLGESGVEQWDQLQQTPAAQQSAALPQAGYYLLKTEESQLILDAGPMGAHGAGHGHADALAVSLQAFGRSLLIDCGTSEYVGPSGDRNLFRGTGQHNTLQVDGEDQAQTATPFSWKQLAESHVEQWIQGRSLDLLVSRHQGYQRLQPPVTHRRWVLSLRNGVYLVRDVVEGTGTHRLDISWHLSPDLEHIEDFVFRLKGTEHHFSVVPAATLDWKSGLRTSISSPVYGRKTPTTVLTFAADAALPSEFAVLLLPSAKLRPRAVSFAQIEKAQFAGVSSYEYVMDSHRFSFFFNESETPWRSGSLSSDAKFVCYRRALHTSDEQLTLCSGSYATGIAGLELRSARRVSWAEAAVSRGNREVFSSDPSSINGPSTPRPSNLIPSIPGK
jgi:hypothetical protein